MDIREQDIRTVALIGTDAMKKLASSRVAVFGLGGVGGHAAEALVRAGIGKIALIDNDTVSVSNINRQIIATHDTVGKYKTEVMRERILSINPACRVDIFNTFVTKDNISSFDLDKYDYIIDAIDTVSAKIALAEICDRGGIRLISSMGTGNKLSPTAIEVSDIYNTSVCPLARAMRSELKKRGVRALKVVYSKETPREPVRLDVDEGQLKKSDGRRSPASISFVPPAAGLIIASEVIRELCGI